MEAPLSAKSFINCRFLYSKIAADLRVRRIEPPWCVTALQAIELERLPEARKAVRRPDAMLRKARAIPYEHGA